MSTSHESPCIWSGTLPTKACQLALRYNFVPYPGAETYTAPRTAISEVIYFNTNPSLAIGRVSVLLLYFYCKDFTPTSDIQHSRSWQQCTENVAHYP
jgi:hypothetical protein